MSMHEAVAFIGLTDCFYGSIILCLLDGAAYLVEGRQGANRNYLAVLRSADR